MVASHFKSACIAACMAVLAQTSCLGADSLYDVAVRDATEAHKIGNYARAITLFELAEKECSQPERLKERITVLNDLAISYLLTKESDKAAETCARALVLCKQIEPADEAIAAKTKSTLDLIEITGNPVKRPNLTCEISNKPSYPVEDGTYDWSDELPYCQHEITDNNHVLSLHAANLDLSAILIDTGRKYRVDLLVKNNGEKSIEVHPDHVSLSIVGKNERPLKPESADKLARTIVQNAKLNAGLANFASALNEFNASQQQVYSTAYISTSGTVNQWCSGYGYGTYSGSSIVTMSSPNYGAMAIASRNAQNTRVDGMNMVQAAQEGAAQIKTIALKSNTVHKGSSTAGAVFFERKSTSELAILQVAIGSSNFRFAFTLKPDSGTKRFAKAVWYGPECMRTLSAGDLLGGRSAPRAEMPQEEETQLSVKETGTN
ncbi:MAG: hypothetical protein QG574_5233 [Cyanobacteriota bacterium erpe_2018_sw_21hr_WHONDRS-SW48-000092_B_bin.40]|nr:hypothetical protein [Cyanobacteriota bacterium erpe_2018_sw_21hr_WHONDRS-SW48-000092_B_bin.40]